MAKGMNFTQASVAKLSPPEKGRKVYRDTKAPGLTLVVSHTGIKTFELYRRIAGRPTRMKLGRACDITVTDARREAVKLAGQIAAGLDPARERQKARAETRFGELFRFYLEGHAKPHKRTWQEDENQYDRYLVPWANRKLSQIRRADVATLHAKIGRDHGRYCANRVLALLSVVFTYAASLGYTGSNPAKGVRRFKEQSRDRFLRGDELQRFFAALPDEPAPWPDLFTVRLLTGARKSNVLAMKWADLELSRGVWKIEADESKNKEPLLIVLHRAAVEILQRRAQANARHQEPSEFVFPSWGKSGHVVETKAAWGRVIDRAGLKDVRLHDLRRTLGSWQAAAGVSLSIIGRSLGHKSMQTTAIYARLDLDPVRASVEAAGDAMLTAAGLDPADRALSAAENAPSDESEA